MPVCLASAHARVREASWESECGYGSDLDANSSSVQAGARTCIAAFQRTAGLALRSVQPRKTASTNPRTKTQHGIRGKWGSAGASVQPCALAVCAFDAQGLGFLTLAGGLLGRVAFVASWRGPTQPNQVKKSSQVKSYILERRPPPPPSRLACRWIANRHGYIVHSALVRSHQSTSAGSRSASCVPRGYTCNRHALSRRASRCGLEGGAHPHSLARKCRGTPLDLISR